MIRRFCAGMIFALWSTVAAHAGAVFIPVIVPETLEVPGARLANYDAIHTVAIVSAIGQTLTLQKNRLLIPISKDVDITDWKLDDLITATIQRDLGGRFAFRDITFDRRALAHIPNGVWDNSKPATRAFLATLPNAGIDAFIVVRPDLEYKTPGLSGLSLVRDNGIGDPPPVGRANYEIDVVDAHTLAILASAYSRIQLRAGTAPSFAAFVGGSGFRLDDDLSLSVVQRDALHAAFSNLVNVSLLETLRALKLSTSLPAVGARTLLPLPQANDPFAAIKTVCVISAIGDELSFDHLGGTIFSQSHEALPIGNWRLDDEIESDARNALGKRFGLKDVAIDHSALLQARLLDDDDHLNPKFPGLQSAPDVDAYILFIKHPIRIWGTKTHSGLGVWNHTPILGAAQKSNAVYANYAVAIVDAHALKFLAWAEGTVSPAYSTPTPLLEIDPALWTDHAASLQPAQLEQIHVAMRQLLTDSVAETLLRTGLTGMMVSRSLTADQTATTH